MEHPNTFSCINASLAVLLTFLVLIVTVNGQISTPCTTSMISGFTPCVNYITGSTANGASPTAGCCNSIQSLISTSTDCVCLIVTGNVPFSLPINAALALSLLQACSSASVPLQCRSTGVPLPAPGPKLFGPTPPPKTAPSPKRAPPPKTAPSPKTAPPPETAPSPKTAPPPKTAPSPKTAPPPKTASSPKTAPPHAAHSPFSPRASKAAALAPAPAPAPAPAKIMTPEIAPESDQAFSPEQLTPEIAPVADGLPPATTTTTPAGIRPVFLPAFSASVPSSISSPFLLLLLLLAAITVSNLY